MNTYITARNHNNNSSMQVGIEEVCQCPICKHAIKPEIIDSTVYSGSSRKLNLSITNLCRACNNIFISQYKDNSEVNNLHDFKLVFSAPNKFIEQNFEDLIKTTSPSFVKIFNQAAAAESQNLDEIAGIGYRKALEFLIKDFLIKQYPDKKVSIEKDALGNCIKNFVENPQLKISAERAVWLGNDQTHYVQKYTDNDINDLKRLIRLTVHWISMILETEEAATIEQIK